MHQLTKTDFKYYLDCLDGADLQSELVSETHEAISKLKNKVKKN
jgi:hypothetical protein